MSAAPWGGAAGRQGGDRIGDDRSDSACAADVRQAVPPIERDDPIAEDNLTLSEVAVVYRLVGSRQGPGTMLSLSRGRGR
jgi:hypothetical protein